MNELIQYFLPKIADKNTTKNLALVFNNPEVRSALNHLKRLLGTEEDQKQRIRTFFGGVVLHTTVAICKSCGHTTVIKLNGANCAAIKCPCCGSKEPHWFKEKYTGAAINVPHSYRWCKNKPETCETSYSFKLSTTALSRLSRNFKKSRTEIIKALIDARNSVKLAEELLNGKELPPWTIWCGILTTEIKAREVGTEQIEEIEDKPLRRTIDPTKVDAWDFVDIGNWIRGFGPQWEDYVDNFEFVQNVSDLLNYPPEYFLELKIPKSLMPELNANLEELREIYEQASQKEPQSLDDLKFSHRSWFIEPEEINLEAEAGRGNYGEVYQGNIIGKSTPFCTSIACKKIRKVEQSVVGILAREMEIIGNLHHKNILKFYGFSVQKKSDSQVLMLVTEFMEVGSLLTTKVQKLVKQNPIILYKLSLDIAEGMEYLHSFPIIHRDLKPDNILLTGHKTNITAKVADFGLSRKIDDNLSSRVGAYRWMAPEVHENGKNYTTASDVFSFGLILWFMVVQDAPFSDLEPTSYVQKIMAGDRPEIPETVWYQYKDLIESCWQKEWQKRPKFSEIVKILKEILNLTVVSQNILSKSSEDDLQDEEDDFEEVEDYIDIED